LFKTCTGDSNRLLIHGAVLGNDEIQPDPPTTELRWEALQDLGRYGNRSERDAGVRESTRAGYDRLALKSRSRDLARSNRSWLGGGSAACWCAC